MLFTVDKSKVEYIPHKREYDLWRSRLGDQQHLEIMVELEKVLNEKKVVVSSFVPGKHWENPYAYIYEACDHDEQNSAFFFGLLMWTAVQQHADNWSFQKYDDSERDIKGMTYFKIEGI